MYAQDSIELLKNSGIDFAANETRGIDVHRFGELLMSSGIVLSEEVHFCPYIITIAYQRARYKLLEKVVAIHRGLQQVHWITFHSGYDFGYLLKILTCQPLPAQETEFFELLQVRHSLKSIWQALVTHTSVFYK